MYVLIQTEPRLWTVGFYDPTGKWQPLKDFEMKEEAECYIHYLNGGRYEKA